MDAYVPGFGATCPLNRLSICSFVGASPGGHAANANLASGSTLLLMSALTSSGVRLTSKPLDRRASLDSRSVPMTMTLRCYKVVKETLWKVLLINPKYDIHMWTLFFMCSLC